MARLIKSEKEVEGRYEEVWTLVDEDALEQWPAGPGDIVGRDAPRVDGFEKARGEARYTADVQLPGMLHTAVLRSPHARAKVRRIDLAAAAAAPGVLAAIGPGEVDGAGVEADFEGYAVAAVAAETLEQAEAAVALIEIDWEELEPLLDPEEAVRRGSFVSRVEAPTSAATTSAGSPRPTRSSSPSTGRRRSTTTRWRRTSASATGAATRIDVHVSTQYIWGVRSELAKALGLPEDKVRVICEFMGGGFGSKAGLDSYLLLAAELARRTGRPVRCALTRRAENMSRATATRRSSSVTRRRPRRRHADRPRRRVHVRARLGRLAAAHRRPDAAALRLRQRPHRRARREAEPPADGRLPRAGLRRGNVVGSSACSTSSPRSSGSIRSSCGSSTTRTPTRWTGVRTRRRA